MTIEVRRATVDDIPALTGVLSRAFSNDPPMSWVFRDEATRVERLAVLFGGALREIFLPAGHLWTTTGVSGAAVWQPPGQWRTPDEVVERLTPPLAEAFLPEELDRFLTFLGMMEDKHADAPEHWYLEVLAADLDQQGQGIGSACMLPVLELADSGGTPAYLESSNEKNVPLYERHGFRVTDVVDLPDGGPAVWLMWREGTSAAN
ncbi:MAG: GNAT family N-acetyltransferase [Actinomycetota bacterium]|nr:GNAT family N-acetyltransferase [Actinomycetota bacterium]